MCTRTLSYCASLFRVIYAYLYVHLYLVGNRKVSRVQNHRYDVPANDPEPQYTKRTRIGTSGLHPIRVDASERICSVRKQKLH